MIINTKEVASLLLMEFAFANQPVSEKELYETEEVSGSFSNEYFDNYLPRLEAYITAKGDAFISFQKNIIKYLQQVIK